MKQPKFHVGDAVKVYGPSLQSELYLYGRIIHVDHPTNESISQTFKYGVLFYGRHTKDFKVMEAFETRLEEPFNPNPGGCPSYSITMDYIDEICQDEYPPDE